MSLSRWTFALALSVLLPAAAASQRAVTVRADNDAFNFWQAPWVRPDEEYTSGVRLVSDYDGAARWARRIARALGPCRETPAPCDAHSYTLGQDIYTAVRPKDVATPLPHGRPDAGVLWVSSTTRVERLADLTELGWTIGVTGRPSLAQSMQQFFHSLAPQYNRAISWGNQLPAEPVFALAYDRRHLMHAGLLDVQPHAGASLGSLLTEARAGIGARLGRNLAHPWRTSQGSTGFTLAFVADATVRAVARNEVLNGALFRPSAHVELRRAVSELQGGVRARWRWIEAAWIAHQTSAEYVARTTPHSWSTLELTWRSPSERPPVR